MALSAEETADIERQRAEKEEATRKGRPWVGFLRTTVGPDGKIQVVPDWNDQFVSFLRKKIGPPSRTMGDEDVVQFWVRGFMRKRAAAFGGGTAR